MIRRVELGGPEAVAAAPFFRAAGLQVEVMGAGNAAHLKALDAEGVKYLLVHVGADDGEPEGSYARAHHRIALEDAADLAGRVRPRERRLVRCLAFGYKHGVPHDATWAIDVRKCTLAHHSQRVLEESGSPLLLPEKERELREAAIRLCQLAGYRNAGSVEFLYDRC